MKTMVMKMLSGLNGRKMSAFYKRCAVPSTAVAPIVKLTKTITAPHRLTGRKPLEYLTSASSVVPKALNQIKSDGYWEPARGDILLTDKVVSECANIFKRRVKKQYYNKNKVSTLNLFTESDFVHSRTLVEFVTQDNIVQTASNYLGMIPVIGDYTLWWSLPSNGALAGSQLFHQDKIDNKQLKLFVNISDITDANGPFCFFPDPVSGSIKSVASDPRGRISDEEIALAGVSQRMKRASGGKGQCLFVDSSRCFHAGSRVSEGHRLVIMVQFIKPNCVLEPKKSAWSQFIDKNPAVLSKLDKKKRLLFERPIWG